MPTDAIGILFEVEGKGSIQGTSGKRINGQLRNIMGQINKSDTVKIKLKIDNDAFKKNIEDTKRLLEELKKTAEGIKLPTGSGSTKNSKPQKSEAYINYKSRLAEAKKYYNDIKNLARVSAKSNEVSFDKSGWTAQKEALAGHKADVEIANRSYEKLKTTLEELGIQFDAVSGEYGKFDKNQGSIVGLKDKDISDLAAKANMAESEFKELYETILDWGQKSASEQGKIFDTALRSWTNNANKYSEWLKQNYSTIQKDDTSKILAKDLKNIIDSNDPKRLDELSAKWQELTARVRDSGSNIETWGQKFKKTFSNTVRSALTGAITAKFTQFVNEIYQNTIKLDEAVVNLQIASGKTREETKALVKDCSDLAKQLGATTLEVAEGADTWIRQGYEAAEANTLITNSTMLAKLGQMEMADASKALTSTMKGYKVEVENSIKVVDKLTSVDMEAAASAGDIAIAMSETATSAKIAGVDMDKLIGYITTVKEVTQDGAESVGTFYKTLFARMNNVAAGKFIDEETGESLNDVEIVLNELGIALRDTNGEFKSSSDVLDDVAKNWNSFDNVAQHAIATAFAGTRQQEKFIVLMDNYGSALEYAEVSAKSAGTATEKFGYYLEGIKAKLNILKASIEDFSTTILDSDLVVGGISFLTFVIESINLLITKIGGLNSVLTIAAAVLLTIKADLIVKTLKSALTYVPTLITKIIAFTKALKLARTEGASLGTSVSKAFDAVGVSASTAQVAVGALTAIIGIAVVAINMYNQSIKESVQNSLDSSSAVLQESKSHKANIASIEALISEYEKLGAAQDSTNAIGSQKKIKEIQEELVKIVGDQAKQIDLVNGKYDEELEKLKELSKEELERANRKAIQAKADAENAYKTQTGAHFAPEYTIIGEGALYSTVLGEGDKELSDFVKKYTSQFKIALNEVDRDVATGTKQRLWNIKSDFSSIDDFAEQYKNLLKLKEQLAVDKEHESNLYKAVDSYLIDFKSIYDAYAIAQETLDNVAKAEKEAADVINDTAAYKSRYDIIKDIEGAYDALSDALTDINEQDIISADTLKTILDPENGYPELEKYLTKTANGYTLVTGALEDYISAQREAYVAALAAAEEGSEAWKAAYQNLENFLLIIATKELERQTEETKAALEKTKDALEDQKKPLEDQKDALEDEIDALEKEKEALEKSKEPLEEKKKAYEEQLDNYEELIEIRKELIETYAEEVEYQKELEKRQRNVASLRTRLSVAKLDTSAAGQARVRELESELQEAEEDLSDFTLEHAIDVITTQLDNQLGQYESYIGAKVSEITSAIDGIDDAIEGVEAEIDGVEETIDSIDGQLKGIDDSIDDVDDAIADAANGVKNAIGVSSGKIEELLGEYLKKQAEKDNEKEAARKAVQDYVNTHNMTEGDKERWGQDPNFKALYDTYVSLGGSINDIIGVSTKMMVQSYGEKTNPSDSNTTISQELFDKKKVVDEKGATYMPYPHSDKDLWVKEGEGFSWEKVSNRYVSIKYTPDQPLYVKKYHTGGLVGNIATLKTSEEFAKLLKGEFVTTPAQMKNFMQKTLPEIASYNSSTGNEFNAPLINISCDNVSTETLPSLEKIVNNAVVEIKKQLDSGMSRAGFKPSAKKLLL